MHELNALTELIIMLISNHCIHTFVSNELVLTFSGADFFPFGVNNGDNITNAETFGRLEIETPLVFFRSKETSIHVSVCKK